MKHLGNLALFGLFTALLAMPLIGFGFMEYQPDKNVLPAEDVRVSPHVEEVLETSEATETSL